MESEQAPLTKLLALAAQGDRGAFERVFEILYPDLRRIAHARLRPLGATGELGTTALVHESFLRLVGAGDLALTDRKHFFAYAAKTMRSIIVDVARERLAERRGGGQADLPLDTALADGIASSDGESTLVRVNDALLELEALDAELARVVEMRYFAGYTEAEVADLLGVSERTVRRHWEKARAFLLASLQG